MNNINKIVTAGNKGKKVRSDCFVTLELTSAGGINIELISKVKVLFGKSIIELCEKELEFFGIKNANVKIEDTGALPFVLNARIEAAVKQLIETDKEYLPEMIEANNYSSTKDRYRFSRLYLPGNTPSMMLNAGIHNPDGIILDLEDSVALAKKEDARLLVRNALLQVNFYGAERMVRINQGQRGIDDLKFVIPHNVHLLLVPKCECAEYLQQLDVEIEKIKKQHNITHPIYYMPIIESAMGVEKTFEIATASPNVVSLAIGLEDYTADMGVRRTKQGNESLYARTRMVNACHAAKIQPIDSVFSDVADMEGLKENVKESKSLGFEGMGCIHPRQINIIQDNFAPEPDEIEKAKKVVLAFVEAEKKGLGVVSLGTKMIDPPVVKRNQKVIDLAVNLGKLSENWIEEIE
ncbi:MAG: citrate lyase acyl carrier protein [Bacteroidales bacterium]|nr:citrate lyase acyl carrier protein [Bacteroidales bacterium]